MTEAHPPLTTTEGLKKGDELIVVEAHPNHLPEGRIVRVVCVVGDDRVGTDAVSELFRVSRFARFRRSMRERLIAKLMDDGVGCCQYAGTREVAVEIVDAILDELREPNMIMIQRMHEATKLQFDLNAAYRKLWAGGIDATQESG